MRNKWKLDCDKKQNKALGMLQQTARAKLERQFILFLANKCDMSTCFQCGFKIDNVEDMSIEHKEAWGGNEYGKEIDTQKFWNLNNLALSHKWCNISSGRSGVGKYKYVGIHDFIDKRRTPAYEYVRAMINVNGKSLVLGHYSTPEQAAIAYDIAIMRLRKGVARLNFEHLRSQYKDYLDSHFKPDEEIFYKRGPIKDIVDHFLPMVQELTV